MLRKIWTAFKNFVSRRDDVEDELRNLIQHEELPKLDGVAMAVKKRSPVQVCVTPVTIGRKKQVKKNNCPTGKSTVSKVHQAPILQRRTAVKKTNSSKEPNDAQNCLMFQNVCAQVCSLSHEECIEHRNSLLRQWHH